MALLMLMGFIAVIALPSVVWLYALADVIRNDFTYFSTKMVWLMVLCLFPPLGTVLYYLIGRGQRITCHPVGGLVALCLLIVPLVMIVFYVLYSLGHLTLLPEPPNTLHI